MPHSRERVCRLAFAGPVRTSMADNDTTAANVERIRRLAVVWIGSADQKATAILAIGGALVAIVSSSLADSDGLTRLVVCQRIALVVFVISMLASIGTAGFVLWPRTSRKSILKASGWNPVEFSASFFGDVSNLNRSTFLAICSANDTVVKRDALEQAFVSAKIASIKMKCVKLSISLFLIGVLALGVFAISQSV